MFDRIQPSKRTKSWRADTGLLSQNSSRGFTSTRWGEGDDDGFMVDDIKRTKDGFALDEYAQVPLSPQAIQALKRLQAMQPDENDAIYVDDIEVPERFYPETWNANAHLPFVADAYEYDDDIDDDVAGFESLESVAIQTEAVAVSETLAPVEALPEATQETNAVSDVSLEAPETLLTTEAAQTIETSQASESSQAMDDGNEANTNTKVETQTSEEASQTSEAQASAPAEESTASASASAEATEGDSPAQAINENANENASPDEPMAMEKNTTEGEALTDAPAETNLVESDLTDEDAVDPEHMAASVEDVVDDVTLPEPVMMGIDPEVVEQREAEKFAQGLAQGIEQGERQAREAMQQEVQAQCTVLANVTQELHALLKDSKAFYEPLKRLAMHLAEQIVMGELRTSTHAIEQLIQRCLEELDHPAQGLVVLELNPDDKARLQAQNPELIQGMRLEAVPGLQPGSVRLFANDAVIEDLVEHRLQALAQSMLADVTTWKAQSALAKPEALTQDLESEDVHP